MSQRGSYHLRIICLVLLYCNTRAYEVPPAIVEPLQPVGFRVSVPDDEGISLFAFHGNINKDFEHGREAGQFAVDVLRKKNGFWTYTNRDYKLKKGDIIYYWLYVIQNKLGYERLFQSHVVDRFYSEKEGPTKGSTPNVPDPPKPDPKPEKPIPLTPSPPKPTPAFIDNVDIRDGDDKVCAKSVTTVNGQQTCSGYLIFDSDFSNGIGRNWTNEVHFNQLESEFVVFDNSPSNSFSESNILNIRPTLTDDYYGKDFVFTGSLDLTDRCTSTQQNMCKREKFNSAMLPPVISARLTTKDSFSFKYGIIEFKARLPRGHWVVPEIWLEPKSNKPYGSANSGRVIMAKSIGNTLLTHNGNSIGNNLLTAGLEVNSREQNYKKLKNAGLWSDAFHVYKLEWTQNDISFLVDGEMFGKWSGKDSPLLEGHGPLSPFDEEFYILLGVHVGGFHDVPNGAVSSGRPKPWDNDKPKRMFTFFNDLSDWHASWNDKTKLQVEYIRVWSL